MERNRLTRWWIWFWYNNVTRVVLVLLGGHLILWVPILVVIGLDGETLRKVVAIVYLAVIVWAIIDKDYSNLRRIGLDEYRKPLTLKMDKEMKQALTFKATASSVNCPYCNYQCDGLLGDPRGKEANCDECGKVFGISVEAEAEID